MKKEDEPPTKAKAFINRLNISERICNHLIGDKHTLSHRLVVGFIICCSGVVIVKVPLMVVTVNHVLIHGLFEVTGYTVHAIGAIPFLKAFFNEKV